VHPLDVKLTVEPAAAGTRLDRWLAASLSGLSRARLQALIEAREVRVDGVARKAAHRLRGGETVDVTVPPPPPDGLAPEPLGLAIVFEDEHLLVVDKPAGMVVHPGAGHALGTLAAGALAHAPQIAGVGGPRRPGIVHRLDKDTSGLLVLAKTPLAYASLTAQLAARTASRKYLAIVHGRVARAAGTVDAPIGRDPRHRQRMAVSAPGRGKRALTSYRVLERFRDFSYLELTLGTGRTHQIRVHLASLGHPVAGDVVYGRGRRPLPVPLEGHALHAAALAVLHPVGQARLEFAAPLPARMERLLSRLRHDG
jgi:23S rRNA pseudouridine1911/1915/1917 synthase